MELPSEEGEMPVPLNSTYGHGHMIHHHDHHPLPPPPPSHNHIIIPSSGGGGGGPPISSSSTLDHDDGHGNIPSFKKMIRYRECLKNHAAAMGGNATDGCGEFMPSGEDGTLEALTCSACNCHRNFHRKEIEGEPSCDINSCSYHNTINVNSRMGRKVFVGHHKGGYLGPEHHALGYHHHAAGAALISSRPPHQMIMSYNMGGGGGGVGVGSLPSDQSDEQDGGGGGAGVMVRPPHQLVKKRFRTKFTPEQKEKMLNFAEKVGWKIQKQEEAVVQHFCQEVGIKRRVLKVWMHNNKHNLAKKNLQSDPQNQV